ncbi:hypothetical protein [Caulobacter sp. BE254]|jgi:hypothetical protein|uniref:hypothetical protein n=1 Tax=Caulobacter sp. BE254 TaxID=2817720 RepID=UPI002854CF78|nr:hypothetical protein [Caulobacter sp. BE254]MDR7115583.1 hypothetical protein [Caulobacter sp. BE254]
MNLFTPQPYDELIRRLALGVEAFDGARQQPVPGGISITADGPALRRRFERRGGSRFALLHDKLSTVTDEVFTVRLLNADGAGRRYVPRRLRLLVPKLAVAETRPASQRGCRPRLFPGAAYPVMEAATGVRGQAVRTTGGPRRPARWTRVVATIPAGQSDLSLATVVGRAFGDDRGEFLLMLAAGAASGTPVATLAVRLSVFARPVEPAAPVPGDAAYGDPLWDAPLEQPDLTNADDPVLLGTAMPAGWSLVADTTVNLRLGRLEQGGPPFEF